ncbi:tape measure protein [[Bacillus] enclensis]|uniref:tape measure protein n=1 Tax=[Bacillus] enclensis TaxID=1402860 RepID=UPI0018DE6271|nr:tape measure protein [[Bacillus] enclensis]MBH9965579.1 tape measure protein [[Bacillus] enclensis]
MLNISYRIEALDGFSKLHDKLDSQVTRIADKVGSIGKGLMGVSVGLGAATAAATGVGLGYLAGMEKAEIGLKTLTGSAKDTDRIMKELQDFAIKTPFEFDGMVMGTRRLIGMGMASQDATEMLKSTADAVAAAGGGSAELDGVITALGQIQAKGKISAEEMNQLAERGIPAWKLLGEQMDKTPAQLMKMAEKGELLAKDALPALKKGFDDTFGGAAAAQASTFSGRLSNLKEQFQILAGAFAEPIFEPLSNAMGWMVDKMTVLSEKFQALPNSVQTMITVGALLTPVLMAIGAAALMFIGFIPHMIGGFAALSAAVTTVGPVIGGLMGPLTLIIGGIIAVGAALVLAYSKVSWFRDMVNAAWEVIKASFFTALTFIKGIVQAVMTEVSAFFGSQLSKIKSFWEENGSLIVKFVKSFMDATKTYIQAGMQFIKGIFQVVWPIISGLVKIAWGIIKTVISTGLDVVLGLVETAMRLLEGDWEGAWESIKGIGEDIWHNIEDFFSSIDLVEIGKDIIRGLIDGIASMGNSVKRTVGKIVDAIPSAVKKLLGIHSPSRVMMQLGGFTAEGMALGIGKGLRGIQNMAAGMANAATPNMGGTSLRYGLGSARSSDSSVSAKQSAAGGITQNITINSSTPLSPSEIARKQREASRRLAMEWGAY